MQINLVPTYKNAILPPSLHPCTISFACKQTFPTKIVRELKYLNLILIFSSPVLWISNILDTFLVEWLIILSLVFSLLWKILNVSIWFQCFLSSISTFSFACLLAGFRCLLAGFLDMQSICGSTWRSLDWLLLFYFRGNS